MQKCSCWKRCLTRRAQEITVCADEKWNAVEKKNFYVERKLLLLQYAQVCVSLGENKTARVVESELEAKTIEKILNLKSSICKLTHRSTSLKRNDQKCQIRMDNIAVAVCTNSIEIHSPVWVQSIPAYFSIHQTDKKTNWQRAHSSYVSDHNLKCHQKKKQIQSLLTFSSPTDE